MLGAAVRECKQGEALFSNITPNEALGTLRHLLGQIGVENHREYRTHDLRRGHADDLFASSAPFVVILRAGDWDSVAFPGIS